MKVLVALALLMGVVYGDQHTMDMHREACSIVYSRATITDDPRITVSLVDATTGLEVQEVRDGDNLRAVVTMNNNPIDFVVCVAMIGQANSRQALQTGACVNSTGSGNAASCLYRVNSGMMSQDKIHIRVGVAAKIGGMDYFLVDTSTMIQYMPLPAGATRPPTTRPTRPTTMGPRITTKKVETDNNENDAVDPHDSKMEAFLAAKYAEMKEKMAEDEDKNSEGDWQKLEEDEKRKHEEEVHQEMEDYERRLAEEKQKRELMIREEMRDKEEHDRIEAEAAREVRPQPDDENVVPGSNGQTDEEIEVNGNSEVVVGDDKKKDSSAGMASISVLSVLLALVAAIFF